MLSAVHAGPGGRARRGTEGHRVAPSGTKGQRGFSHYCRAVPLFSENPIYSLCASAHTAYSCGVELRSQLVPTRLPSRSCHGPAVPPSKGAEIGNRSRLGCQRCADRPGRPYKILHAGPHSMAIPSGRTCISCRREKIFLLFFFFHLP